MTTRQENGVYAIALDANTFRNLGFVNFLHLNKDGLAIYLPSIVHLELGYYFMSKGISWDGFMAQLQKFNGTCMPWDGMDQQLVLKVAINHKNKLSFKSHFRDFLIGVQCMQAGVSLVTYNEKHFTWCTGITVTTPETFVEVFLGLAGS